MEESGSGVIANGEKGCHKAGERRWRTRTECAPFICRAPALYMQGGRSIYGERGLGT